MEAAPQLLNSHQETYSEDSEVGMPKTVPVWVARENIPLEILFRYFTKIILPLGASSIMATRTMRSSFILLC